MPPEYIDHKQISDKFDIFSLGIIILKIINGPAVYSRTGGMESDKYIEHVRNLFVYQTTAYLKNTSLRHVNIEGVQQMEGTDECRTREQITHQ